MRFSVLPPRVVIFLGVFSVLTACTESTFNPPAPRTLPAHVILPGGQTLRIGERFRRAGFRYLRRPDPDYPPMLTGNSPLYDAPRNPRDSLERIWAIMKDDRIHCVVVHRSQSYPAAFDSLAGMFGGTRPVWTDSSSGGRHAVWSDGHTQWWLSGHFHPDVLGVGISVKAVEPAGRPFDPPIVELC